MKKEKKYLSELESKLKGISKKKKEKIINKYQEKIKKEKENNKRIVDILKELGTAEEVSKKEIEKLKSNNKIKSLFKNIKEFITKDIQLPKKEKNKKKKKSKSEKTKYKRRLKYKINKTKDSIRNSFNNIKKSIKAKFSRKKKDTLKENIIETKEEIVEELPNVIESITEKKVFESKSTRIRRTIFKTIGIVITICLLFLWLWVTVILMASMFAILDGIKFYGLNIAILGIDILLLIIVILVNKAVVNKKISVKWTIISIILTLVIIALGITLFLKQVSNINIVKDVSDKYSMTRKYEKINLPSNIDKKMYISFNTNYDTQYVVEYDNTLENKFTIETKYYESYYDYYMKRNSNDVYVSLSVDFRDRLSVYLENLKENKVYDKNELSRYIVKITMNERDKERIIIEN